MWHRELANTSKAKVGRHQGGRQGKAKEGKHREREGWGRINVPPTNQPEHVRQGRAGMARKGQQKARG